LRGIARTNLVLLGRARSDATDDLHDGGVASESNAVSVPQLASAVETDVLVVDERAVGRTGVLQGYAPARLVDEERGVARGDRGVADGDVDTVAGACAPDDDPTRVERPEIAARVGAVRDDEAPKDAAACRR
jgi:hypothetical protein